MNSSLQRLLLAPFALLLVAGCVDARSLQSKADLDRLTQRYGMGHLYYIGSEDDFHYFATKYFGERKRLYKLPAAEYSLQNTFPKTKDESKWIPHLIDLNANTKGFQGEPREPLRQTNSAAVPAIDGK